MDAADVQNETAMDAIAENEVLRIEMTEARLVINALREALRVLTIEAETFAIIARFQGTPLTQFETAIEAARQVCYDKSGAPADTEVARLRAGITQFAAAMKEPDWAWDEMTGAQQEAYNALMGL